MSISEREAHALESIENGLDRSAPKLASMLAIFSRLAADEAMPAREAVRRAARGRPNPAAAAGRQGRRAGLALARRHCGKQHLLWLWIVAAALLLTLALTLSHNTGGHRTGNTACKPSRTSSCPAAVPFSYPAGS